MSSKSFIVPNTRFNDYNSVWTQYFEIVRDLPVYLTAYVHSLSDVHISPQSFTILYQLILVLLSNFTINNPFHIFYNYHLKSREKVATPTVRMLRKTG